LGGARRRVRSVPLEDGGNVQDKRSQGKVLIGSGQRDVAEVVWGTRGILQVSLQVAMQ